MCAVDNPPEGVGVLGPDGLAEKLLNVVECGKESGQGVIAHAVPVYGCSQTPVVAGGQRKQRSREYPEAAGDSRRLGTMPCARVVLRLEHDAQDGDRHSCDGSGGWESDDPCEGDGLHQVPVSSAVDDADAKDSTDEDVRRGNREA